MKPAKILIFIILIISALASICLFFPKGGISIGKAHLHFPSLDDVFLKQEQAKVEIKEIDSVELKQLNDLKDTLQQYRAILTEGQGHFYLPNDDVTYFDNIFQQMEQAKRNQEIIRVLHYGDSQIEMDRISGNLRTFFQQKFGGGGPGLVPVIQTIPSFAVSQYASGALVLHASYGDGARANGNYGLMAKCYYLDGSAVFGANASIHRDVDARVKRFSNVTLLYNDRLGNFSATLQDRKHPFSSTCTSTSAGIHHCHFTLDSGSTTSLQLTMQGNADIYGVMLDNGYGVAVDNIPLRGSSGNQFSMITDTLLRACYQQANVGMIILQFGGNTVPALHGDKSIDNYCKSIEKQIRYLKRCYPNVTLLFIGPSDMSTRVGGQLQTYPLLPKMIEQLRATVLRNHVAYWDIYEVMGGENAMVAWVQNGLAGPDYVHFTPAGARKVGKCLSNSFSAMYDFYLTRQKITPQQFDTLWHVSSK